MSAHWPSSPVPAPAPRAASQPSLANSALVVVKTCSWDRLEGRCWLACVCRALLNKAAEAPLIALGWGLPEGRAQFCSGLLFSSPGSSVIFGLKGYVAERKGEREEMQDAHVILNDITEECRPPSSLM